MLPFVLLPYKPWLSIRISLFSKDLSRLLYVNISAYHDKVKRNWITLLLYLSLFLKFYMSL